MTTPAEKMSGAGEQSVQGGVGNGGRSFPVEWGVAVEQSVDESAEEQVGGGVGVDVRSCDAGVDRALPELSGRVAAPGQEEVAEVPPGKAVCKSDRVNA